MESLEKEKEEIQLIKQSNFIPDEELTISNSNSHVSNKIHEDEKELAS